MKSSTLIRSMLSKESINVLETLSDENTTHNNNNKSIEPDYYHEDEIITRNDFDDEDESKSKEIDLLWQNFKTTQFNTQSPVMSAICGFILGVLSTIIVFAILGFTGTKNNNFTLKIPTKLQQIFASRTASNEETEQLQAEELVTAQISVPAEEETANSTNETSQEETSESEKNNNFQNAKQYTVVSGDTAEGIIKRFYGAYSPEKAELIMKANNLSNLDRINIGQVLIIPAP